MGNVGDSFKKGHGCGTSKTVSKNELSDGSFTPLMEHLRVNMSHASMLCTRLCECVRLCVFMCVYGEA